MVTLEDFRCGVNDVAEFFQPAKNATIILEGKNNDFWEHPDKFITVVNEKYPHLHDLLAQFEWVELTLNVELAAFRIKAGRDFGRELTKPSHGVTRKEYEFLFYWSEDERTEFHVYRRECCLDCKHYNKGRKGDWDHKYHPQGAIVGEMVSERDVDKKGGIGCWIPFLKEDGERSGIYKREDITPEQKWHLMGCPHAFEKGVPMKHPTTPWYSDDSQLITRRKIEVRLISKREMFPDSRGWGDRRKCPFFEEESKIKEKEDCKSCRFSKEDEE